MVKQSLIHKWLLLPQAKAMLTDWVALSALAAIKGRCWLPRSSLGLAAPRGRSLPAFDFRCGLPPEGVS